MYQEETFVRFVRSLIILLVCFAVSYCAIHLTFTLFGDLPLLDAPSAHIFLSIAGGLLLYLLLYMVISAIAGLLTGWQLAEASLLGLGLHRDAANRLRLMYRRPARFMTLLMTPPHQDGTSPLGVYYLAAPCTLTTLSATMLLLALAQRSDPAMANLFWAGLLAFCVAAATLLLNTLPVLRAMRRHPSLHRATEHHLTLQALQRRGLGLTDMPAAALEPYPEADWTRQAVLVAQCNVVSRRISDGDYAGALTAVGPLLAFLDALPRLRPTQEKSRTALILHGAACEALTGAEPHIVARLAAVSERKLPTPLWIERLLLARYLQALLIDRNEAAAAPLLSQLEEALARQPEKPTASTRRMIEEGQALAHAACPPEQAT